MSGEYDQRLQRGAGQDRDVDLEQDGSDYSDREERPPGKRTLTENMRGPAKRKDAAAATQAGAKAEAGAQSSKADDAVTAHDLSGESELTVWAAAEIRGAVEAGMSELHTCFAGCLHGQFDSILAAAEERLIILPGAVEDAIRRYELDPQNRAKEGAEPQAEGAGGGQQRPAAGPGAAPAAPGARPAPAPAPAPEPAAAAASLAASSAGHEVAHSGTVSDGVPAGFPGVFGLATWSYGAFTYPDLKITARASEGIEEDGVPADQFVAEVATTTSADAATSAIATPAGTYPLKSKSTITYNSKPVQVDGEVVVDAAAAGQIRVAEQEHLDDVSYAYEITLKAAEAAVNAAAAYSLPRYAKSKAEAIKIAKDQVKDALDPKLGADPATWRAMLRTCAELSKSGRDRSGWHTFSAAAGNGDIDIAKKFATFRVQPNANVGSTPSSTLIKL